MTADMSVLHLATLAQFAPPLRAILHEPFTFKETGARGTGRNAVSR